MQLAGLSAERAVRLDRIGGYVDAYQIQIPLHTIAKERIVACSTMRVRSGSSNKDVFFERLTVAPKRSSLHLLFITFLPLVSSDMTHFCLKQVSLSQNHVSAL